MNHFEELPEFTDEFKQLHKKYRTLEDDRAKLEKLLQQYPTGAGKNFTTVHSGEDMVVVKVRMACQSLRDRSLRVVYAYHAETVTFLYIEIYAKSDKANEDRGRIKAYLKEREGIKKRR